MSTTPRSLRRSLTIALGLLILDGFVLGQGIIAVLLALGSLFIGLPRALWAWKDRPLMRHRLAKVALYFATALLIVQVMNLDARYAEKNAGTVIAALERYRADEGRYPDTLEALVAKGYLPALPKARFSLMHDTFLYHAREGSHRLIYIIMPPFGGRVYELETHTWETLD